jgi:tetratricopeptide (TPR) repeat protein
MSIRGSLAPYLDRNRAEIAKLVILAVATILAFAVTRTFANRTIEIGLEDAAEWHARGQDALGAGKIDEAVEAFRRALSKDRNDRTYGLALAEALAMSAQPNQALPILLSLRERAPEDPDVNLELGRLAARNDDMAGAVRYYQSALYAPPRNADGPRTIRLELIQLLLQYDENERALSELIAAADDAGDDPVERILLANLTLQAGDAERALEQFQQVLTIDADSAEASSGAGTAAFRLGDFTAAARYLRAAPDTPEMTAMRATAELVLSRDPLAARIRASERRRRLTANLAHVRMRLEGCMVDSDPPNPEFASVANAIEGIERRLRQSGADQDLVDDGIAAVYGAERFLEPPRCGPLLPIDRALLIIAERHGGGS